MNRIEKVIVKYREIYENMKLQDIMKLIYQNEFGCGHLVKDEDENFIMLMNEWKQVGINKEEALFEEIGNGYARMNIRAAKEQGISIKLFQDIFLQSAKINIGSLDGFYRKIEEFKKLCGEGGIPFSVGEVEAFIREWEQGGRLLFSHSKEYKNLYSPAYRVISKEFIKSLPILMDIERKIKSRKSVIVGIDGRCGAGKTTFSKQLADFYNVQVIHMDDFFLSPDLRIGNRHSEPGGNIHYERFNEEVAENIRIGREFEYSVFSCKTMDYIHKIKINPSKIIIVEGSYSMHPIIKDIYDIKVFCNVEAHEQKRRIIRRNGLELYKNFELRWIPMEEKYFEAFKVMKNCDYILV